MAVDNSTNDAWMKNISINKEKVLSMLTDFESEQIERTISTKNTDKFGQAICAFSNDLSNTGRNGYIFIGAKDNGTLSGLKAKDSFLQSIGGLRSNGNILPQPIMSVQTFQFDDGDIVVIEVQPSPFPPVRFNGKTWIRVGPRKAVANNMEERVLTEKRSSNVSMFDIRPCLDATIDDLDLNLFKNEYLPKALDSDILKNDNRDIKEQLAALRFFTIKYDKPTNAGILLFGKNPEYFIPGNYTQYVKFKGLNNARDILNEKKFSGNLFSVLKAIESFIDNGVIVQRPVPVSTLKENTIKNFPNWAIRELMMNAVMHRDYESNAPIKFYQYEDRIEIGNAGGLYGKARPENFPNENDYRNPTIAEAMKVLGYVNRFNRGISRVQEELKENGNTNAIFEYSNPGAFNVSVNDGFYNTSSKKKDDTSNKDIDSTSINTINKKQEDRSGIEGIKKSEEITSNKKKGFTSNKNNIVTSSKNKKRTRNVNNREIIIALIRENRTIQAKDIAAKLGITEKGVRYHMGILIKDGKGSKWVVL